jgi:hypothetical protein
MNKLAVLIFVMALSPVFAEEGAIVQKDLGEYQTIVDRQMFGPLPETFDPTKSPGQGVAETRGKEAPELTKEQENIQKSVHFSVINRTPSGESVVGFSDNSNPKEPRHYYMKVGEKRDGWLVKNADAASETMTLVKDGVEVTMKLGDKSGSAVVPAAGTPVTMALHNTAGANTGTASSLYRRGLGGGLLGRRGGASLRSRRLEAQKEAEEQRMKEEASKRAEEETRRSEEAAERKADREAVKAELNSIRELLLKNRKESTPSTEQSNENNNAQ